MMLIPEIWSNENWCPSYPTVSVDSTYLLEHLVDVTKDGSMQVPILVPFEAITETALLHLEHGVLDGHELVLHNWTFLGKVGECTQNVQRFGFTALEDEPGRTSAGCELGTHTDRNTHQRGDSGKPGMRAMMNSARMIWKAMGKRQETVDGSKKENPRSSQ